MRAWLFQDHRQKAKLGDSCPWSVGWLDPAGKRKSKRIGARTNAERFARKIEGQLEAGVYQDAKRASWEQFKKVFEERKLSGMKPNSRLVMQVAMGHFERIIKPGKVSAIKTGTIADYVARRRQEPANEADKDGPRVADATINKELRSLRVVMRRAAAWEYMAKAPEFDFLKEVDKLPSYVTPEHFGALYHACDDAASPKVQGVTAADWWRGLLVMAYMTGWRIGSLLAVRWDDVDLDAGTVLSRAEHNKGKRDQLVPLHPLVIEHLRKLRSFSPLVFPWPSNMRVLYDHFHVLQKSAEVRNPLDGGFYGFHDFRRAFATLNAGNMPADALQALMQHKDYKTTQRYINLSRQLKPVAANLYTPDLARKAAAT